MEELKGINQKLRSIQLNLKAPKNLYNAYSSFYYRNAESILENLKPLLEKFECVLKITDEVKLIGERYYIEAKAVLIDLETGESVESTAYAREEESKKGMDAMQLTGACSSYARKYCLNALFLLDDTKDADALDNTKEEVKESKATKQQINMIVELYDEENVERILNHYKVNALKDLNVKQASEIIKHKKTDDKKGTKDNG